MVIVLLSLIATAYKIFLGLLGFACVVMAYRFTPKRKSGQETARVEGRWKGAVALFSGSLAGLLAFLGAGVIVTSIVKPVHIAEDRWIQIALEAERMPATSPAAILTPTAPPSMPSGVIRAERVSRVINSAPPRGSATTRKSPEVLDVTAREAIGLSPTGSTEVAEDR